MSDDDEDNMLRRAALACRNLRLQVGREAPAVDTEWFAWVDEYLDRRAALDEPETGEPL